MSATSKWMNSGVLFDIMNPTKEMVRFSDIADTLEMVIRHGGQGDPLVSVMRHTVICAEIADLKYGLKQLTKIALMHDMHEAYTGDIPTPVKRAINAVAGHDAVGDVERRIDWAIEQASGFEYAFQSRMYRQEMKWIDRCAMAFELEYINGIGPSAYSVTPEEMDDFRHIHGQIADLAVLSDNWVRRRFCELVKALLPALFDWESQDVSVERKAREAVEGVQA